MNQSTVKSAYAQGIGFAIPSNTVRTSLRRSRRIPARTKARIPASSASTWPTSAPASRIRSAITAAAALRVQQVFSGSPADQRRHSARRRDPSGRRQRLQHHQGPPRLHRLEEAGRYDPAQRLVAAASRSSWRSTLGKRRPSNRSPQSQQQQQQQQPQQPEEQQP